MKGIAPKLDRLDLALGAAFLVAGALTYAFARPNGAMPVLIEEAGLQSILPNYSGAFGSVAGSAPSFFHSLAISLLLMAALTGARSRVIICVVWLTVSIVFELGQKYSETLVSHFPNAIERLPLLHRLVELFSAGTFDPTDLFATGIGVFAAMVIGLRRSR